MHSPVRKNSLPDNGLAPDFGSTTHSEEMFLANNIGHGTVPTSYNRVNADLSTDQPRARVRQPTLRRYNPQHNPDLIRASGTINAREFSCMIDYIVQNTNWRDLTEGLNEVFNTERYHWNVKRHFNSVARKRLVQCYPGHMPESQDEEFEDADEQPAKEGGHGI